MADFTRRVPDCDDGGDGERGERGHRGRRGRDGATGPTGPAGAAPTGDPNTQAYFGPTGGLTDDTDATMTTADWIQRTFPGGPQAIHVNRVIRSVAIGEGATASGTNALAVGEGSVASGNSASALGFATTASGDASHAEGAGSSASGLSSHAEGDSTTAIGKNAHAEGANTIASGNKAHAEGDTTTASGDSSHAGGMQTLSSRVGQWGYASGQGGLAVPAVGASQTSLVTMVGETPGLAASESVELVLGPSAFPFVLEDGKDYTFTVSVAAGAVQPGPLRVGHAFIIYFNARRDAGVSVITASGVGQSFGDPSTADWTFVASIGVAPDRIVFTFTTGAVNSAAKVTAEVRFVEIAY